MSDELKFPREYPTVPGLDEIDPKDFVALKRARDQRTRERFAQNTFIENFGILN